ncbi:MAG TPA: hypothetical protein VJ372_03650, partial [Pyrinomonadaceae bacterium]|nr:hypothetical protein [Pyrinomonadaceae bacterium]
MSSRQKHCMLAALYQPHNQKARPRHASILASILIHLIFSTKNREAFLTPEIEAELYPYMASILKALKSPALIINGT